MEVVRLPGTCRRHHFTLSPSTIFLNLFSNYTHTPTFIQAAHPLTHIHPQSVCLFRPSTLSIIDITIPEAPELTKMQRFCVVGQSVLFSPFTLSIIDVTNPVNRSLRKCNDFELLISDRSHARTTTLILTHARPHANTRTCTHTHTLTYHSPHAHIQARTRLHTDAHTHRPSHTHTDNTIKAQHSKTQTQLIQAAQTHIKQHRQNASTAQHLQPKYTYNTTDNRNKTPIQNT